MDWDDMECRVAREESRHQAGIGTCSLALQIGFFFDGLKRNINVDEESQRLTNVGRLFRAHQERRTSEIGSSYVYSAVYVPGLGTPLDDTATERLHSIMDARQKALPRIIPMRWLNRGKKRR
ncbi:DUF2235 domain-containing protein [Pectobacterium versatile]|uniref:DUF2235 domain-containing protein n=1 Tax=Pectobacterium versatile TaxID=2488639 RepID=UPI001F25E0D3|nr:DUF2235 domain-containing protein [Pectobacterium versatile]